VDVTKISDESYTIDLAETEDIEVLINSVSVYSYTVLAGKKMMISIRSREMDI
jgi:hypothetical protein